MPTIHDLRTWLGELRKGTAGNEVFDAKTKNMILERYKNFPVNELSHATVRDFCDSMDYLPQITQPVGTLKDVQRPWVIKAILGCVPLGSNILEIGGGDPFVSDALQKLGYRPAIIDPYDGSGNGPQAYYYYTRKYPNVRLVRAYFEKDCPQLVGEAFDCIFSVSVLEHVPHDKLKDLFEGIDQYLKPGGHSIHCVDQVVEGMAKEHNQRGVLEILAGQYRIQHPDQTDSIVQSKIQTVFNEYREQLLLDVDSYYNSPLGHNRWRTALKRTYDEYPFRKITSMQTCVKKP